MENKKDFPGFPREALGFNILKIILYFYPLSYLKRLIYIFDSKINAMTMCCAIRLGNRGNRNPVLR